MVLSTKCRWNAPQTDRTVPEHQSRGRSSLEPAGPKRAHDFIAHDQTALPAGCTASTAAAPPALPAPGAASGSQAAVPDPPRPGRLPSADHRARQGRNRRPSQSPRGQHRGTRGPVPLPGASPQRLSASPQRLSSAPLFSASPLAPGAPTYLTAPRSRAGPGPPASRQPAVRAGGGGRRRPQQSEGEQPPLAGRGCRQAPRSPQQRHVRRAAEQRIVGHRRTRWAERRGGARLPARARGGGGGAGRHGSAGTALPPWGALARFVRPLGLLRGGRARRLPSALPWRPEGDGPFPAKPFPSCHLIRRVFILTVQPVCETGLLKHEGPQAHTTHHQAPLILASSSINMAML